MYNTQVWVLTVSEEEEASRRSAVGDIRGVDFRLVISQSNGLLINVDRRPYRLKTKAYNHDYSATVKTCHTADVKSAGGFSFFAVTSATRTVLRTGLD